VFCIGNSSKPLRQYAADRAMTTKPLKRTLSDNNTDQLAECGSPNKRIRQQSVVHSFAQKAQCKAVSQKEFEFEILSMLVDDMQPIATVERSGFKKLFQRNLPNVDLPSRRTLARNIDDMYDSHKQQLIEELKHID